MSNVVIPLMIPKGDFRLFFPNSFRTNLPNYAVTSLKSINLIVKREPIAPKIFTINFGVYKGRCLSLIAAYV